MKVAIVMIALSYILPTIAGLASVGNWQGWGSDGVAFLKNRKKYPVEGRGVYYAKGGKAVEIYVIVSLFIVGTDQTDDCVVLTLQNGFPEEKAKTVFSEQNIMGGSMEFSATFKSPGVTELASEASTLGLTFGNYLEGITGKVIEVKGALKGVGHIEVTDNIRGGNGLR